MANPPEVDDTTPITRSDLDWAARELRKKSLLEGCPPDVRDALSVTASVLERAIKR